MDRMFAPWRLAYAKGQQQQEALPSPTGCIFCDYPTDQADDDYDQKRLVVAVREHAFVMLNKYPYGNGHAMVLPRRHVADLAMLPTNEFVALQELLQETVAIIQEVFRPDGMNIGMNVGSAGGAGLASHLHWHLLPCWHGDVNFLPVFADTRVIVEALDDTWHRLRAAFASRPHLR